MKVPDLNGSRPPSWMERLLTWLHPAETLEEVTGDLEELYAYWLSKHGKTFADLQYFISVVSVMPPFVRKRQPRYQYNQPFLLHPAMIQNYFKIAFRNLLKNKLYSFINLTGLSLGLGVAITLFWIVRFEYSFDDYHSNADRIYRIASTDKFGEKQSHVPQGVIKALNTQAPGVEMAGNLHAADQGSIKVGTKIFAQKNIFFSPPEILKMLDIEWIEGSPEQSLSARGNVVIDDETARKLFGNDNAAGKSFRYNNEIDLTVTGIISKVPANTEFPFQMIISRETLKQLQPEFKEENYFGGGDSMNQGFVLLKKGSSARPVNKILASLARSHTKESIIKSYALQPLSEMHFDTGKDAYNYSMPQWIIYTLASIGLFLIFIACINFINLATVQSIQRGREIAMRKVLGSGKGQLIGQFFGETALLVFSAVLMGSLMAVQLIGYAPQLLGTKVAESEVWEMSTFFFLFVLGVMVTLLAGLYPASVLSKFEPVKALQNRLYVPAVKGISLGSTLVVLQFVIAQVLVICTILGIKQIRYFQDKDLGFEKTAVVTVTMPDRSNNTLKERFTRLLANHNEIRDVTYGLTTPASQRNHWWSTIKDVSLPNGEETFRLQHVDTNYFRFFHIPIIAGRGLTSSDTTKGIKTSAENIDIVINEKAARDLGFKDPVRALGKRLEYWGSKATVVGIVKNYHSEDLKSKLMPHIYSYGSWNFQLASIRVDPAKKAEAIKLIGKEWTALFPNHYYDPKFLEDEISSFYENERNLSNFIRLFACVGIIIGSLGLFGLVSFVVTRRTKEIGVRKVLGATVTSLVTLLSQEFLVLVIIAFVTASPLAYYAMSLFLQEYTYKIAIEGWVFILAGAISAGIALITVSFQSIKAALMDPVKSLKSE